MTDRGYTVTLTVTEYDALKGRIAQLEVALKHARKFCRNCSGTGQMTSWNLNGGAALVKCECRLTPTFESSSVPETPSKSQQKRIEAMTAQETIEKCVKCGGPLPPLEQWSTPACPSCTSKIKGDQT